MTSTTSRMPLEHRQRREKISEVVAREIVRDIVGSGLKPGRVLGLESEMLERYRVSRASLREALRILEVHGLITLKPGPGGGPVVGAVDSSDYAKMLTLYLQVLGATFSELMEARLHIEPFMARLAARRTEDLAASDLRAVLDQQTAADAGDDAAHIRLNTAFHAAVANMSGNRILDLMAAGLKDIFTGRVAIAEFVFPPEGRAGTIEAHRSIGEAILGGREREAEQLMQSHMADYALHVMEKYPQLRDEIVEWRHGR